MSVQYMLAIAVAKEFSFASFFSRPVSVMILGYHIIWEYKLLKILWKNSWLVLYFLCTKFPFDLFSSVKAGVTVVVVGVSALHALHHLHLNAALSLLFISTWPISGCSFFRCLQPKPPCFTMGLQTTIATITTANICWLLSLAELCST